MNTDFNNKERQDNIVVGLDIGTTKIACFVGRRAESSKISILGYAKEPSAGVERGIVKNILEASKTIARVVDAAAERSNYEIEEVYVGIAGQHIRSLTHQGAVMIPANKEYIEQDDIDRLMNEQSNIALGPGEEIIHIFPQTWFVDEEELAGEISPIGVRGKQLKANFHIVTCNTMNLMNIRKSVQLAGLRIVGVVLEPIASALAVLDEDDKQAGVALVDIGGGTTDIAIFQDGIIRHTSVLPLAGNVITNDIRENCRIQKSQAESLKMRFGSCLPEQVSENDIISIPSFHQQPSREINMRHLASIIKQRTNMIMEQVNYEIQKSGISQHLNSGIVLTGGGAQLRHLKEYTEFLTTIYTRIGYPNVHLEKDTDAEINDTMYATGIGLVIYGIELLEEEERRQRELKAQMPEPEPEPEPQAEPEPANNDIWGNLPPMGGTSDQPSVEKPGNTWDDDDDDDDDEETKRPKRIKRKEKSVKSSKNGWFSSVEKYINKLFTDTNSDISNEGDKNYDID
ncbi:MAG: cell division protein FtsA [Bacteroidales bacterium]|nr:cell division protein FtsA [Bacteroidales bacterium]